MNRVFLAAALWLLVVNATLGAEASRVPAWDARGLGPLPWQGIACVDVSADGTVVALGTISPPGDPNLVVLDAKGCVVSQRRIGLRWVDELKVAADGQLVAAVTGTPEGTAGDAPRLYAFRQDEPLTDVAGVKLAKLSFRGRLGEARSNHFGGRLFHFGDHSNHLAPALASSDGSLVVASDDGVLWLGSGQADSAIRAAYGRQGFLTALAAGRNGLAIIGLGGVEANNGKNLIVLRPDQASPVVWSRTANRDVAPSPAPEPAAYGPSGPMYEDLSFQAPLSLAIDASGERFAVADYEGRRRVCYPTDGGPAFPFGVRFTPSRPTIHVYDAQGAEVRRVGPESFPELTWCDLTFTDDGQHLLLSPHNWGSRGLGGQPRLPVNPRATTLYQLDIATGDIQTLRLSDAIASVAVGGEDRIAVGCWNHRVYLFDGWLRPIASLPDGMDVGAASLVRFAGNGQRLIVATAAGTVLALDSDGRPLWRTELDRAVQPGDKPWTRQQRAGASLAPGVWRTNGGLAHSDMGAQFVVQAPQGLLLIDPNAGASFEQNWAMIEASGLDPRQVKYVLLTHEHGDHAPGAHLWRANTGAQVVASAEAAYLLRHHVPGGTGYGFHPPQPVDIVIAEDTELDLAGLKVRCLRLPGHTYGSIGYAFEREGRVCVATGDLIMPGGTLGYAGSMNFSAEDALASLRKLAALKIDVLLGGHGGSVEDIARGIRVGEATGWGKMPPEKPDPRFGLADSHMLPVAWNIGAPSVAFGDVDGDGRPDVAAVVAAKAGAEVRLYLNHRGRFNSQPDCVLSVPEVQAPAQILIRHVNDDARPALYVRGSGEVCLVADRAFPAFRRAAVTPADAARIFDLAGATDTGARPWKGVNREDVVARTQRTGGGSPFWRIVDVNGDGRADLLDSAGRLFLCWADGTLPAEPTLTLAGPEGGLGYWGVFAMGDFNGDGRPDTVTNDGSQDLAVYYNTGQPETPYRPAPDTRLRACAGEVPPHLGLLRGAPPAVADWNGDSVDDLVIGLRQHRVVTILPGGSAGLDTAHAMAIPLDVMLRYDHGLTVADFDGDGRLDLALFGYTGEGTNAAYLWLRKDRP